MNRFFFSFITVLFAGLFFVSNVEAQDWKAGWHSEAIGRGCDDYRQSCRQISNWSGQQQLAQQNYYDNPNNNRYNNRGNRSYGYNDGGYYNRGSYPSYGGQYGNYSQYGAYGAGQPIYNFGNTNTQGGNGLKDILGAVILSKVLDSGHRDDRRDDYDDEDRSSNRSSSYRRGVQECINRNGAVVSDGRGGLQCRYAQATNAVVTTSTATNEQDQGEQCKSLDYGDGNLVGYSSAGQVQLSRSCARSGKQLMMSNKTSVCSCR